MRICKIKIKIEKLWPYHRSSLPMLKLTGSYRSDSRILNQNSYKDGQKSNKPTKVYIANYR
ncbi:hypothetical protein HanIR_Chr12g0612031 [Helianthus annuus]|nr:hypothetical protein HanIR_Chr12g0612031 [Helianthus annuus]